MSLPYGLGRLVLLRQALFMPLVVLAINCCAYAFWIKEAANAYSETQNLYVVDDFAGW